MLATAREVPSTCLAWIQREYKQGRGFQQLSRCTRPPSRCCREKRGSISSPACRHNMQRKQVSLPTASAPPPPPSLPAVTAPIECCHCPWALCHRYLLAGNGGQRCPSLWQLHHRCSPKPAARHGSPCRWRSGPRRWSQPTLGRGGGAGGVTVSTESSQTRA